MTAIWSQRLDEADGVPVTTATAGPDLFDSVNPGGGSVVHKAHADPLMTDFISFLRSSTVGGSGTPTARVNAPPAISSAGWLRWYQRHPGAALSPSNLTFFRTSETDLTGGLSIRTRGSDGRWDVLNATFGTAWSAAFVPTPGEWYRIEAFIDTAAGEAQVRLFTGANLHGVTPDEDSGVISADFGDAIAEARFGHSTGVVEVELDYDEIAFSDVGWLGPAVRQAAPVVDAGADLTGYLTAGATLSGSIVDDGLPVPPGAVSALWEQESGPSAAVIADPSALSTAVSFSDLGSYVFKLTGDDGDRQASDTVAVTVEPDPIRMLPDVEALFVNFLRAQPEVAAIVGERVYGRMPQEKTWPMAVVTRIASTPIIGYPPEFETVGLQVDCWGGPKGQAHDLAQTVRAVVARLLDDLTLPTRDVQLGSMSYLPDQDFDPPKARYAVDVFASVRATST